LSKNESIEYIFDSWERQWEKEHPLAHWVNRVLFKEKTFFSYAPSYALTHPWKILEDFLREVKWAWQRVFRKWDDRVTWGLDCYLSEIVPQVLDTIRRMNIKGISADYLDEVGYFDADENQQEALTEKAAERFDLVLKDVADGFRAYSDMDDVSPSSEAYAELMEKFQKGMNLFVKYFSSFGD